MQRRYWWVNQKQTYRHEIRGGYLWSPKRKANGESKLLVSPVADEKSLVKLGVDPDRPPVVGTFTREQEQFLEFHRAEIFRRASRR